MKDLTPKEKAVELVDSFVNELYIIDLKRIYFPIAKQCALIAVDEIVQYLLNEDLDIIKIKSVYWSDVYYEITKL